MYLFASKSSGKAEESLLEVTAEGAGGGLAQWEQCSRDVTGTRLHSAISKPSYSPLFLTDEEQRPYYNKGFS